MIKQYINVTNKTCNKKKKTSNGLSFQGEDVKLFFFHYRAESPKHPFKILIMNVKRNT